MKKLIHIYTIFFLCLLFYVNNAQAQLVCEDIPIDDFSSSAVNVLEVGIAQPLVEVVDDGGDGVTGRFRTIAFELIQAGQQPSSVGRLFIEENILAFSNETGVSSRANILYNADGNGLSLDLSRRELLRLNVTSLDTGISFTYILTDENDNQASLTELLTTVTEPMALLFPFEDFTGIQNVDLSAIESFELIIEGTQESVDASIERVGFGCQESLPPATAVPAMSGVGYLVMVILLVLLGACTLRKASI